MHVDKAEGKTGRNDMSKNITVDILTPKKLDGTLEVGRE